MCVYVCGVGVGCVSVGVYVWVCGVCVCVCVCMCVGLSYTGDMSLQSELEGNGSELISLHFG